MRCSTTLQFSLVLTVAAIPVAMPTVLSVTMAVGARLLAKKQAIVSRLVAIEELAGVDVLCADKTGTLTQNKLTLGDPFGVDGIPAEQIILTAALASRADNNDTIDLAVLGGVKDKDGMRDTRLPFHALRPGAQAHRGDHHGQGWQELQGHQGRAAGDPGPVRQCRRGEGGGRQGDWGFCGAWIPLTGRGTGRGDGQWKFLGVLPLFDPPREDAKSTIATACAHGREGQDGDRRSARHRQGDREGTGHGRQHPRRQHARRHEEAASEAVVESIEEADGFAQVFPEHKFHIVDVLQHHGHIIGMTGDGVNDAPALKKADCGIAVSSATDAARAAAAIVLLTPGLSVIIDAIKESRRIFQRMNSYAIYRIAETIRVLLFMTLAILVFNFYPLTAVMIVMLALLNDGAILSIAYDNVHYKDEPESWNMRMVLGISTVLGVIGVVSAFALFYLGERVFHLDRAHIQTLMYLKLSVAGHLTIFLTRTRGPFWSIRPAGILWMAVLGTQIIATLIAVYGMFMTPIGWGYAGIRMGVCPAVVPGERPHQAARVPLLRPAEGGSPGHRLAWIPTPVPADSPRWCRAVARHRMPAMPLQAAGIPLPHARHSPVRLPCSAPQPVHAPRAPRTVMECAPGRRSMRSMRTGASWRASSGLSRQEGVLTQPAGRSALLRRRASARTGNPGPWSAGCSPSRPG